MEIQERKSGNDLLNIGEVAEVLQVSKRSIIGWLQPGGPMADLKVVRLRGKKTKAGTRPKSFIRVRRAVLDEWVKGREQPAQEAA